MPGSNFTYVNTVPASGDNPSVDQPNMLGNTTATNGWVSQDHYGFNTSGPTNNFGGLHQQVTFPGNNVPSVPTSPPALFTNLVNSLPQLFFYSGTAAQGSNQYSTSASNGSTMLLGGIILKWGTGTFSAGSNNTPISFNKAFPNNLFVATVTLTSMNPVSSVGAIYTGASGFTAYRGINTTNDADFRWIAIGN